jgi:arabinofuranan 3-O-arabinosyltransferase
MSSTTSASNVAPHNLVPSLLRSACLLLAVLNAAMIPAMYLAHAWLFDAQGRFIITDFVNVWAAGRLALDGHPALAWDWLIHKQVEVAMLGQNYAGDSAWHYPPPFLFTSAGRGRKLRRR